MAQESNPSRETRVQNSEIEPKKRPSGGRIEKIIRESANDTRTSDKGQYGEMLRPSEREDSPVDIGVGAGESHRRPPTNR